MNPMHPALVTFDRSLRAWLGLGLLAVLLLPAARGHSYWVGWLPFWLLAWPALALALLHRSRWQNFRVRAIVPRRVRRRQARRHAPRLPLRRALLAAIRST
jgi:hypothetical protein